MRKPGPHDRLKWPIGRVPPDDPYENTRDHERIWFKMEQMDKLLNKTRLDLTSGVYGGASAGFDDAVRAVPGLRAYWRLGEADGVDKADTAGHPNGPWPMVQNNGVIRGTYGVPGLIAPSVDDGACEFFGYDRASSDTLSATGALLGQGSAPGNYIFNEGFSFFCFVQPHVKSVNERSVAFGSYGLFGSSPALEQGWYLDFVYSGTAGSVCTMRFVRVNGTYGTDVISQVVAPGIPLFVVGTYDGATMHLYINGTPISFLASTVGIGYIGGVAIAAGIYDNIAYGPSSCCYDGIIDECGIYSVALTTAQVAYLYGAFAAP